MKKPNYLRHSFIALLYIMVASAVSYRISIVWWNTKVTSSTMKKIQNASSDIPQQKKMFSIKDFFSKCDQICKKLRSCNYLCCIFKILLYGLFRWGIFSTDSADAFCFNLHWWKNWPLIQQSEYSVNRTY